jgi:hypothetical protein
MRFSLEKESRNPVGETENAMAKVILTEAVTLRVRLVLKGISIPVLIYSISIVEYLNIDI